MAKAVCRSAFDRALQMCFDLNPIIPCDGVYASMIVGNQSCPADHFSITRVRFVLGAALGVVIAAMVCGNAIAGGHTSCTTGQCLGKAIPFDQKPSLSADDCKALDGKTSSSDFDEDLGLLCRLRVARALASFREQAPCINDGFNPDWSISLKEPLRLRLLNDLAGAKHFETHGITVEPKGVGYNNSTIHGSYVYNRFFYDTQRAAITYVSAATYFCRSGSPEHYVPFFFVLKINDGPDANQGNSAKLQTLAMEYVETLPVEPAHAINQIGAMEVGIAFAGYDFGDVNADGKHDLVIIEARFSEPPTGFAFVCSSRTLSSANRSM